MYTIPVMPIASKVNSRELAKLPEDRLRSSVGTRNASSFREQMDTQVKFDSDVFNTTQSLARYARPGNYGDDAARWLMEALEERGTQVIHELGQDCNGWYFSFLVAGTKYEFTLEWSGREWVGTLERSVGLVSAILGGRGRGISQAAVAMVDQALKSNDEIYNIRWKNNRFV